MEKVAVDEVENRVDPLKVHSVRKPVSKALGTDHFAMNYFELEAGESFSGGLHAHGDQEEVSYAESGTATFEVGLECETERTHGVDMAEGAFELTCTDCETVRG